MVKRYQWILFGALEGRVDAEKGLLPLKEELLASKIVLAGFVEFIILFLYKR